MLDFTSALYLGLHHPSASLPPWDALTLGRPAALSEPPGSRLLAGELARLQGFERATLQPSTWHLFWDLLQWLRQQAPCIALLDEGSYPILHWAANGLRAAGCPVAQFAHHDVAALADSIRRSVRSGRRPIVLADGYCPGCNRPLPLAAYARVCADWDGLLVIDDTQALGVLGAGPDRACPYGRGGGGSLRWHGLAPSPGIAVGASLAKGFGAPLAVLAGASELVDRFERGSLVRVHCSPPSVPAIRAARSALRFSTACGDMLRARLLRMAVTLRRTLAERGLVASGSLPFPVQSFAVGRSGAADRLYRRLLDGGIRALPTRGCRASGCAAQLTFLLTAQHRPRDIARVAATLAAAQPVREH